VVADPGAASDKSNAFNAALTQNSAPPTGSETSGRADLAVRPDIAVRGDGAVRTDIANRPEQATAPDSQKRSGAVSIPDISSSSRPGGELVDGTGSTLPVLQLGASDKVVGLLQRALAILGYETLRSDDIFGPKTDEATRGFQGTRGLAADGIVGNRETWPALNQALVSRHEGVSRLTDAISTGQSLPEPRLVEMKQLNALLSEVGVWTTSPKTVQGMPVDAKAIDTSQSGELTYTVRGGETLSDVARMVNLPVSALIAANPELSKPYLILQGQLLILPNPPKERRFRRPPRQLHPADPDGHLANPNMNPAFVTLINGMIQWLRGEGHDVRVIAGFRTFREQQRRFEQGRVTPGKVLTDLEAGHSWHNYGLAVDIVLNDEDGQPAWPEESSHYWRRLGDVALAHGASWGGLFGHPAHVEYHPRHARGEARTLIDEFESYGLEGVWERLIPTKTLALS